MWDNGPQYGRGDTRCGHREHNAQVSVLKTARPTASARNPRVVEPIDRDKRPQIKLMSILSEVPISRRIGAACPYQTLPSRQPQDSSAVVSRSTSIGITNTVPSLSGVRTGPVGPSTEVGPRHGSQPRAV